MQAVPKLSPRNGFSTVQTDAENRIYSAFHLSLLILTNSQILVVHHFSFSAIWPDILFG